MLEAGEELDKEFLQSTNETPTEEPLSIKHQSPSPNKDDPESFKPKKFAHSPEESDSESSSCSKTFKTFDNYMPLTERVSVRQLQGLNRILNNLQEIQNAIKENHALNKKVLEAAEAYTKNSTNLTELFTMVKNFDFPNLKMTRIENTQATIQSDIASLKTYTSKIKAMMTEIFYAFNGQSFSTPSSSGEKDDMITEETMTKTADVEKEPVQEPRDTEPIPITIVRPTVTPPEIERPQLTDPIIKVKVSQPKSPSHTTLKPDRGKSIARDTDESPRKLVPTSKEVHQDPDAPVLILFEIYEVATKAGVDPKALQSLNDGKERKPKIITVILIHPNPKPIAITVYRGNDQRTFEVHNPFRFGDFGITEWDELNSIIPKKKNKVVGELMTSFGKKYGRMKVIPEEIGINPSLPALEQVPSLSSGRKRKAQELEPEVRVPGLECNRSLLEGVQFVNNKSYLEMATNINTPENQRLCAVMRSMIDSHPNKEKLKSKRVKLEAIGYLLN
ncbi:hypothetical protein Tco_1108383 [Tanacetum coccineum]